MGRCPQFRDSAIYLSAATCPQVPGGQVSVDGGRKRCPPSTPIGLSRPCKPSAPRRWIAELPVPADMEIRMICANRRPQRRTTKTWKRYVLRNRPCGGLCGRLSGTYCSQVDAFETTWEHWVSEKHLSTGLQGHFFKIYCSQVISSAATWRLRTFG